MYAIVKIAGEQCKVSPENRCFVPKLPHEVGSQVTFGENDILLVEDEKGPSFGTPYVKGGKVIAEVVKHTQGPKKIVFKKKRRKGYKVKRGHRQNYTQLLIKSITQS